MANVTVTFSLDSATDQALITWLDSLPRGERSLVIRQILQAHIGAQVTLVDVYQAIRRIEDRIDQGLVVTAIAGDNQPADQEQDQDQVDDLDILESLGNLGL